MTKGFLRASLIMAVSAVAILAGTNDAQARYQQQGIFGGRQAPDGAIDIKNPIEPARGAEAGVSVANRPRPEFDPIPINVGSFQMFPSLELGLLYDSNVYAENSIAEGAHDVVGLIRPAVSFFSNWNRHALSFAGQGDVGMYFDRDKENFSDGILTARGRFDIRRQSYITYGGDYQRLTEARASPDSTITNEPATYNFFKFMIGNSHQQGKFGFKTNLEVRRFDFDPTSNNTTPVISLDFRDRDEYEATGEVNYDLMRFWKPFIRGGYTWHDYDSNSLRNNQGYHIVGGTGFEFSRGILTGEAFGGWQSREFRNIVAGGATTSGPRFGGNVLWNVTNLTSVEVEMDRNFEETTLSGFRSYTNTGGSLTVTHELMRSLLLEGNFDVSHASFEGGGDRQDNNYRAGLGGRYYWNRHFYNDVEYNFSARTSDVSGIEYKRHTVAVRFGAQM